MKRGDTAPDFRIQCIGNLGVPLDLTDATAKLLMKKPGGQVLNEALVVEAGTQGFVNRAWVADDLDQSGCYLCEVEITYPGGAIQTVPAWGHIKLYVSEDLG
jgi:hypothetical protein